MPNHANRVPRSGIVVQDRMFQIAPFLALLLIASPIGLARATPCAEPGAENPGERIASRLLDHDPDGAVAVGERAVESCPEDSRLWLSLGEAYGAKARVAPVASRLRFAKKCKAAFEKSAALDPKNLDARIALFTYLLEAPGIAGGSVSSARRQAEEIARLDAARGHSALGSLALREKDFPKAESELRMALAAAQDDRERAELQCRLAVAYVRMGKKEEALAALRSALRLDPENPEARREIRRIGGETLPRTDRTSDQ